MKLNIFPIHATPSHYGNRCCRRLTHARAYTQNQMNIFRSVTTNDIMVVFAASAIHRNWRKVLRARINPRQFRMKQCIENFLSIQIWYWLICEWFEYGCRPFFDDSYASRESNICTRGVYRYTIERVFVRFGITMGHEHGIGYTLQLGTSFASALFSSLLIHVHIGVSGIVSCMNLSNEYVFGRWLLRAVLLRE